MALILEHVLEKCRNLEFIIDREHNGDESASVLLPLCLIY